MTTSGGGSSVQPKPPELRMPKPPVEPRPGSGAATDRGTRRPNTAPEGVGRPSGSQSARYPRPSGSAGPSGSGIEGEDLFQRLNRQMRHAQARVYHYERDYRPRSSGMGGVRPHTALNSSLTGSARLLNTPMPPSARSSRGAATPSPSPRSHHSDTPSLSAQGWIQWNEPTQYRQEVRSRAMQHVQREERKFRSASRAVFNKRVEEVEVDLFERLGPDGGNAQGRASKLIKDRLRSIARHKVQREMSLALEARKLTDWDFRKVVEVKEREYQDQLRDMRAQSRYQGWVDVQSRPSTRASGRGSDTDFQSRPASRLTVGRQTPSRVGFVDTVVCGGVPGGRPGSGSTSRSRSGAATPRSQGGGAGGGGGGASEAVPMDSSSSPDAAAAGAPDGVEPGAAEGGAGIPDADGGAEGAEPVGAEGGAAQPVVAEGGGEVVLGADGSVMRDPRFQEIMGDIAESMEAEEREARDAEDLWDELRDRFRETHASLASERIGARAVGEESDEDKAWASMILRRREAARTRQYSMAKWTVKSQEQVQIERVHAGPKPVAAKDAYVARCRALHTAPIAPISQSCGTPQLACAGHALDDSQVEALSEAVQQPDWRAIRRVDLSDAGLRERGSAHMLKELKFNPVEEARLPGNTMGLRGCKELVNALQPAVGPHHPVTGAERQMWRTLHTLDIGGNHVGNRAVALLAQALQNTGKTLHTLSLRKNNVTDSSARVLADLVRYNNTLTHLDLSWNNLRAESSKQISAALRENMALQKLDLSWNGLMDEGGTYLGWALGDNTTLTSLDLSNTQMRNGSCLALALGLTTNKSLEHLGLENNNVGGVGGQILARVLKDKPALVVAGLSTCSCACGERQRLPDLVERKRGAVSLGCRYRLDMATSVGRALAPLLIRHEVASGEKAWTTVRWKGTLVRQYGDPLSAVDGHRMSVRELGWDRELPRKGILEIDCLLDAKSTFQEPWGLPQAWKMESVLGDYEKIADTSRRSKGDEAAAASAAARKDEEVRAEAQKALAFAPPPDSSAPGGLVSGGSRAEFA